MYFYKFICIFAVNLRCVGGEVGATSSLAPKIGPLGLVSINLLLFSNNFLLKIPQIFGVAVNVFLRDSAFRFPKFCGHCYERVSFRVLVLSGKREYGWSL